MEQLKGLILSGGKGTRLRPITYTSAKQLVPVANKPVLFYGIEAMAAAGIREVGIIIAPETGGEIREAAGDGDAVRRQDHLHRAGRAARARARRADRGAVPRQRPVRDVPRRQPAPGRHRGPRGDFRRNQPEALILLTRVPDPQNYGVAELDADGGVTRLVEKPAEPASDLALVGVYMFTPRHPRGRAGDPAVRPRRARDHRRDPVAGRRSSAPVESHVVRGWWKDTGRLDDMLEANRLILETLERRVEGELVDSPRSRAAWSSRPGAVLERSTVRGPAIIGAGARLVDAYIGPYTAIGRHCVIESAEIEHSILLEGSSVQGPRRAHGVLAARPRRRDRPRRAPAARLPLHGRRLVRDRDPLGVSAARRRTRRRRRARDPSPTSVEPSGSSFSSRSNEPSRPPRLSIMCTSVASRVHGTTGEPCSSWPWWLRMMCSTATASSAGKPGQVLDQPADAVVAERDLALELAQVGHVDRQRVGRVGVELADVVQQRAGDRHVAVHAAEGRADRRHALRDGQLVLEQAVPVGLVVALGRRRLAERAPRSPSRRRRRVQQRAQVARTGPSRSARAGRPPCARPGSAGRRAGRRARTRRLGASRSAMHRRAARAARRGPRTRTHDPAATSSRGAASSVPVRSPSTSRRASLARTIRTWSISCPGLSSRTRTRTNPRHGAGRTTVVRFMPDRTALVTGGAGGLGRSVVDALVADGWRRRRAGRGRLGPRARATA